MRDVPVHFKSCLLPGLGDSKRFKELLGNSTYKIEIHNEDLFDRVMTPANLTAYNERFPWNATEGEEAAAAAAAAAAAPAKGGKGKAPAAPAAPEHVEHVLPDGPIHESDEWLVSCLW